MAAPGLLGLGGARQWYRPGTAAVGALEAQQVALELEHPLSRLLLEQGGHVVGEGPQQGQPVLDLLGVDGPGGAAGALGRPVVLELLQAAFQGLAVVMERIQPEERPKNRSKPMQAAARASST
jgi:hypothetical protein